MIVDAFAHVLPRPALERFVAAASGPSLDFLNGLVARAHLAPMWDMDARFRSMDEVANYVQILTWCSPPIEQVASGQTAIDLARLANDSMAELVARHADRFLGFAASLPMDDVGASMAEMERACADLGSLGVQIFTNVNGRPLDDPRFEPMWAKLTELDRTVWVHGARRSNTPDYEGEAVSRFGMWAALGWPYEMGLFSGRMVATGVFDRYPELRFYLHHSGGITSSFSRRINGSWLELQAPAPDDEAAYTRLDQPVPTYFKRFLTDTSGQTPVAIEAALKFFGPTHVLLGSDAPFISPANHLSVLNQLDISPPDRALVEGGNAHRHILRGATRASA